MTPETSEVLRNQIADLRREAARLRIESDRLLSISDSLAQRVEDLEKQNLKPAHNKNRLPS